MVVVVVLWRVLEPIRHDSRAGALKSLQHARAQNLLGFLSKNHARQCVFLRSCTLVKNADRGNIQQGKKETRRARKQ